MYKFFSGFVVGSIITIVWVFGLALMDKDVVE